MFHLRAFVSERLSAAAVDIFGEVEKSLSLYQVEVSRSREEIILLRQQLELLRDNNTDSLQATGGNMLDRAYMPPALQENDQGPPGTPVDEEEESEDYRTGPSENTEHDMWTSCTNPEIPQIKEEQDEFSIAGGVGHSPDVAKSESYDRDGAEMDFTDHLDRSLPPNDDDSDEDWVMGDERRPSSAKNRKLKSKEKKSKAKSVSDGNKQVGSLPPDDDDGDEEWLMTDERQRLSAEYQKFNELNVSKGLNDGNEQAGVTTTSTCEEESTSKTSCHFCGKSFRYRASLTKHIKKHDNMVSDCCLCGKTCTSTDELLSHLSGDHSNKCDICGRTFSQPHFLIVHARTHTGVREHVCNDCGRAFTRKDHLVLHARTHSGEKPYACDICGKAFSQSSNLNIHRRCHTGEKPYQCLVCNTLFSTSSQLKTHMRHHLDEKPYRCEVCGKHFRQSGEMTRHKRATHDGERRYGCTVCSLRFRYAPTLKAHLKTHEETSPNIPSTSS